MVLLWSDLDQYNPLKLWSAFYDAFKLPVEIPLSFFALSVLSRKYFNHNFWIENKDDAKFGAKRQQRRCQ